MISVRAASLFLAKSKKSQIRMGSRICHDCVMEGMAEREQHQNLMGTLPLFCISEQ